jgi:hypothetical protein
MTPINIFYKSLVSLTLVISVLFVAGISHLGENPLFAGTLSGVMFMYICIRPQGSHITISMLLGGGVALAYKCLGGGFNPLAFMHLDNSGTLVAVVEGLNDIGAFCGTGALLVMSFDMVWTGSRRYSVILGDSLLVPIFSFTMMFVAGLTMVRSHLSYDFLLYNYDVALGLTPGSFVSALFRELPAIRDISYLVYIGLLFFPMVCHGLLLRNNKRTKVHLVHAYIMVAVLGPVLYMICPAMGPSYAFKQQFPDSMPAMAAAKTFMATGVFNAVPSLHMTWALLVFIAAWELGYATVAPASLFVIFTGLATVGFGEHYMIDLIVAIPLAVSVTGLYRSFYKLSGVGLGLVVAWLMYLRSGLLLSNHVNWMFVISTVTMSVLLLLTMKLSGEWDVVKLAELRHRSA